MSETNTDTIVRIAGLVVVLGLVAPFVITGAPAVVGAEESYVVLSGSMAAEPEPVIKPGDVVIVNSVNADALGEGDIITFDRGGDTPTTHRIVAVEQQDDQRQFVTKGDNNEDADPQPVAPDQVIGRVMFTIPLVGHVVQFANTTLGFATLVGLPIGLLVVSEAWALARNPDRDVLDRGGSDGDGDGDGAGGSEPTTATDPTTDESADLLEADETVTLGESQLKMALIVLVPVVAASSVAAYRLQTAWALTLLYASLGLFVLGSALYVRLTGWLDTDEADSEAAATTGSTAAVAAGPDTQATAPPIVTGRVRDSFDEDPRVVVDVPAREELLAVARDRGRHAIEHPTSGELHLVGDQTVFRYAPDGGTTSSDAGEFDDSASDKIDLEDPSTGATLDGEIPEPTADGGNGASPPWDDSTADTVADPLGDEEPTEARTDDTDEWVAAVERTVADDPAGSESESESPQGQ